MNNRKLTVEERTNNLFMAVEADAPDLVKYYLENNAGLTRTVNNTSESVLMFAYQLAYQKDALEIFQLIAMHKPSGCTEHPIRTIISNERNLPEELVYKYVDVLLTANPAAAAKTNGYDGGPRQLIELAAEKAYFSIVSLLAQKTKQPSYYHNGAYTNALTRVLTANEKQLTTEQQGALVSILIQAGAKMDLMQTLRNQAITEDKLIMCVDALVTANPKLAARTSCKNSYNSFEEAIELAANRKCFKAVRILAQKTKQPDLFHADAYGRALIQVLLNEDESKLAPGEQYDLALLLLQSGASVNQKFKEEYALHIAARKNNRKLAGLLYWFGAKGDVKNAYGKTPMDVNKECIVQGWAISERNRFMFRIYEIMAQGVRQNNPLSIFLSTNSDVANIIFAMLGGGESLNLCTFEGTHKKMKRVRGLIEEDRAKRLQEEEEERINLAKREQQQECRLKVEKCISAYRVPDLGQKWFSINNRTLESQSLINAMERVKNSPADIKNLIDNYFMNMPLEKFEPSKLAQSRAVRLLKEYGLVTDEQIQNYLKQRLDNGEMAVVEGKFNFGGKK